VVVVFQDGGRGRAEGKATAGGDGSVSGMAWFRARGVAEARLGQVGN
jgi:hypothetical protein